MYIRYHKSVYNHINLCKIIVLNWNYRIYHAVNENRGTEAVAPAEVLGVGSSITLACKSL